MYIYFSADKKEIPSLNRSVEQEKNELENEIIYGLDDSNDLTDPAEKPNVEPGKFNC